ncbi:MAG: DUF4139 domain-containing protein [Methanosarcina sp.]
MRMKGSYLLFILVFLCVAGAFIVSTHLDFGTTAKIEKAQTPANGISSAADAVSENQEKNPLNLFAETANAAEAETGTEVTVYNENLALVKEKRSLSLNSGVNEIKYTDVAAFIDPTSVMFEDTKNKDTAVLEQNYEYDLVSSEKLLEKFLDKEVIVTGKDGDNQRNTYTGTLLSSDGGVVLRLTDGKVVTLSEVTKVEFPDSADLLTKPTLVWQIYSPVAGNRDVLTSYLTGGMSWKADYIVKTNANDTKADIQGWVSVDNAAGTTYENAKLKLVAGEVHRIPVPSPERPIAEEETYKGAEDSSEAGFAEESLFEYHLYTLDRPATLKNNQTKQLSLLSVASVPVIKELIFAPSEGESVKVMLNLTNSEGNGLGMPLPAGVMRVYKADSEGQLQFLGEDSIKHTPKDEEIRATIGNAFDVTGKRIQTEYNKVSQNTWIESYETELKNHKPEAQKVKIVENFYGDWKITKSSDPYIKKDAFTAEWEVTVPANGSKKVTYTVERTY